MPAGVLGRLRARLLDGPGAGANAFRLAAGLSLALQVGLLLSRDGLWGGGDLPPHLRLAELTREDPGLHNPYAPAYHVLGALLEPLVGFERFTAGFALASAALLIAGFRAFQKAAALPDESAALFALTPYLMSLSWCTPKVEAAGYALLLFGLACLLRERRAAAALALGACFAVHTASALLFGIAGGALCLARRDARGLAALAAGSALALPLVASHLAAGCSLAEALLFAPGGYARGLREGVLPPNWPWLAPLAGPVALVAAALGAPALWRRQRAVGILCAVLAGLYLTNLWLAPFGLRSLVTLLRGLSVLAIPVAAAAGVFAARSPTARAWVLGASAAFALAAGPLVVPRACFVRPIAEGEIRGIQVERCTFQWRQPGRLLGPR